MYLKNEDLLLPFKENFIWVVLTKIVAIWKSFCLIEISSCLVKHTEVTQKYISELTELKKSKDNMQPDKTYFCISYFLLRWLCLPDCHQTGKEMQGSFCLEL